jgi:hypothetical protein
MSTTAPSSEADILARIVDPEEARLPPELARSILGYEFRDADRNRMDVLAEKARQGTLTPDEHIEIDRYERIGNFLSLLKSQARRSLKALADSGRTA